MDHQLHQSRNLSVHQTLDEILGISFKSDVSSSSTSSNQEKNALNSPMRPPTRHGRDSVGSNEENKDPVIPEPAASPNSRRNSEADDFIRKLNDIRRRSLISTIDVTPSQNSNSLILFPESPIKESRPRLEIHVEEAEPVNPVETGQQQETSLTFRVDENKKKTVKAKEKPPKKEEVSTSLMQKSMFNSANSKTSDAHHKEWLLKKEKEIRNLKLKKKEEEERKAAAEKERRENSTKLYQRWVEDHDEKMKKLKEIRKSKEKDKREKENNEKKEKKVEAEKNYEIWKRERSKSVTDLRKKVEEDAEKKRKAEEEAKEEKLKEASAAFLAWKSKKEEFLSDESRKKRREEKEKQEKEEQNSKEFRFLCATEAYETWIEMKEKEREMLADLVLIEAPPIPWIPPSNLVPRQFVKSAHGNRPKTRSQSAKSTAKRSRSRPSTTKSMRPFR